MEREQIIKALECCTRGRKINEDIPCLECPYNECNIVGGTSERQTSGTCQGWLMKDALALINELTVELDAMRGAANSYKMHNEWLTEENEKLKSIGISKDIIIESINEVIKQLNEENERLKADTLNDMQTRFAMHFGTYRPTDEVKVTEVFKLLKKISGEMLY